IRDLTVTGVQTCALPIYLELHAWRALDALRAAPGRWGSDPVFFYGFDDLHPLQRDAVQTLSGVAGVEVMVSLTYEPDRAALLAQIGRASCRERVWGDGAV